MVHYFTSFAFYQHFDFSEWNYLTFADSNLLKICHFHGLTIYMDVGTIRDLIFPKFDYERTLALGYSGS